MTNNNNNTELRRLWSVRPSERYRRSKNRIVSTNDDELYPFAMSMMITLQMTYVLFYQDCSLSSRHYRCHCVPLGKLSACSYV